jgi:hypothetical protein
MGVTRRVDCTDGGTFNGEDLTILDRLLTFPRRVLVDSVGEVGVEAKKIWNPAGVIPVPVG